MITIRRPVLFIFIFIILSHHPAPPFSATRWKTSSMQSCWPSCTLQVTRMPWWTSPRSRPRGGMRCCGPTRPWQRPWPSLVISPPPPSLSPCLRLLTTLGWEDLVVAGKVTRIKLILYTHSVTFLNKTFVSWALSFLNIVRFYILFLRSPPSSPTAPRRMSSGQRPAPRGAPPPPNRPGPLGPFNNIADSPQAPSRPNRAPPSIPR